MRMRFLKFYFIDIQKRQCAIFLSTEQQEIHTKNNTIYFASRISQKQTQIFDLKHKQN